jgi:hypothetical protein
MTPVPDPLDELRTLLDALCEDSITDDQFRRLEELVLKHPEAEAYYVQFMSLYSDLVGHFGVLPRPAERILPSGTATTTTSGTPTKARPAVRRRWRFGVALLVTMAAGVIAAIVLWDSRPSRNPAPSGPAPERLEDSVAVLLQAPGAVWGESELPTRVGAPLSPGRLSLKSGFAHIEFYCGATVILEGPAEFRLVSRTEGFCERGKLRASVPPQAQGFTIGSPKLDLVDRGTEFGLLVNEAGKTEVHVFAGKVDLYDPGSTHEAAPRHELTTGRGLRLDEPGAGQPIPSDAEAFLTVERLAKRRDDDTRLRQQEWLTASEALRHDPDLVVYYPFRADQPWSRTLEDRADHPRPRDGAIVGCAWAPGRWPGKQGLEFKQVSDRVRFHVPGEYDSLTLAAWVRVDGLVNRFNSLMMTDGWEESAPHWHISEDGKLELGVQGPKKKGGVHYYSPQVFTADRLGQWVHLAVVYDRPGGRVTHYVDGRSVSQESLKLNVPLRIGDAELGNWNVGSDRHNHPIRFFNGCMDEFLIFSRALSGQEVEQMCARGRPPS